VDTWSRFNRRWTLGYWELISIVERFSRMATTAHFIQVPVETLEIVDLPGVSVFKEHSDKDSSNELDIELKLKSAASSKSFKRKVGTWSIQTSCDPQKVAGFALLGSGPPEDDFVTFHCAIGIHEFFGEYSYETHSGRLRAYDENNLPDVDIILEF